MSGVSAVLQLHDIDMMMREMQDAPSLARLRKLNFDIRPGVLERARRKVIGHIDRRWLSHYERALHRYGRAVTVVRDRVCLGCFITLPTSVSPPAQDTLTLCESCGRILYWR